MGNVMAKHWNVGLKRSGGNIRVVGDHACGREKEKGGGIIHVLNLHAWYRVNEGVGG